MDVSDKKSSLFCLSCFLAGAAVVAGLVGGGQPLGMGIAAAFAAGSGIAAYKFVTYDWSAREVVDLSKRKEKHEIPPELQSHFDALHKKVERLINRAPQDNQDPEAQKRIESQIDRLDFPN